MQNVMLWLQHQTGWRRIPESLADEQPLRSELLSLDLLKQFAQILAQNRRTGIQVGTNLLLPRLADNEKNLRDYNDQTLQAEKSRRVTPAAEWLLDNFHLIEEQIRMARRHLPRGFNRQLQHLVNGPHAGFPRVYEIAFELISHVDGRIDAAHLTSFVSGYQEVAPLKLGELWAVPIMLRLALIENLRRVAVLLSAARRERDEADYWAGRILDVVETDAPNLIVVVGEMAKSQPNLTRAFVTEFLQRMQAKSPPVKLVTNWIEERLAADGLTVEQLVQSESQHQATTQVSVGNCIGSLRFLDAMDWQEFVESQSVVEQVLRTDPSGVYPQMDFATRDLYRHTVERIARFSELSELEVAARAVKLTRENDTRVNNLPAHIGFYLAGKGVAVLEKTAQMRFSPRLFLSRLAKKNPLPFYLGGILTVMLAITLPLFNWVETKEITSWALWLLTFLTLICASQLGVSLVNWFATLFVPPSSLPRLDFSEGIPASHSTLVVVPTMLTSARGIENLIEALEVRYLANCDQNVYFALLTDFCDAPQEHKAGDEELVRQAAAGIRALNQKYRSDRPSIFHLFHRPRRWNENEKVWMGYERKRGKLSELNHCLRGGDTKVFSEIVGDFSLLPHIKYIITLDTDTQLPRDAARQLAATMAHPLNAPVYDPKRGLIVDGYSILQPRVAVSLPSASRSRFVKLFSGDAGLDPYTRTVSDVFQDVFQEGSFIGKGIYDLDAFERSVGGKFPENRILSHDLLEGCYARSGLVSDVQLFEDFPSRYNSDTRRRHRWMRGDWQIMAWLLPRLPGADLRWVQNPLTGLSRWKIFDNLRRTLVPAGLIFLLVLGWILFPQNAGRWSLFVLALIGLPSALAVLTELLRQPKELPLASHLASVVRHAARQGSQALLTVTFLPYDVVISLDAVARTLWRLFFSRRNLLEWQTASDVEQRDEGSLRNFFVTMWCAPVLAVAIGLMLWMTGNERWLIYVPFLLLWIISPAVAWWISVPLKENRAELTSEQVQELRKLTRKTWNYFETFVTPEDHWLPPDNFQEYPQPVLATRTSPTNIGLAMLGALSAYDFGYLSLQGLTTNLTNTIETLKKLERYQGHFYNWYDTRTLKPLPPLYISTVDNGNFSGLLLTLHSGLLEVAEQKWSARKIFSGLLDTLHVLIEQNHDAKSSPMLDVMQRALRENPSSLSKIIKTLDNLIESSKQVPGTKGEFENWRQIFEKSCREHRDEILRHFPWVHWQERLNKLLEPVITNELKQLLDQLNSPPSLRTLASKTKSWLAKLDKILTDARVTPANTDLASLLTEMKFSVNAAAEVAEARVRELENLAQACDALARMDYKLLYDPSRELLSIGYNVSQHRLETSCYDLLASEARLASFVAIALGQLPQSHWFRLGRLLTGTSGKPALISWSGSMFEYLMPMLVMPSYENTLLDLTCKSAVARQIEYGRQIHIPWGISESGYNLRDTDANYQYRAFGVPGLGFKRGLAEDMVIAPYATVMALMVAPEAANKNINALRHENAEGRFGFYEALDYTPSRVLSGQTHTIIRSFMAHHQGMSLLSLAHLLLDRPMQRRFHANPIFQAADLLLHERVPKETSVLFPHEYEAGQSREAAAVTESNLRVFTDPNAGPPEVHLLSNGHYHVMITNAGGGYSRWNEFALTRWREDPTRDCWGTFFYLRDVDSGKIWSTAHQPTLQTVPGYEAIFSQGRAEFRSRMEEIETHTEIAISPENDVEVRRVTFTNHSDETRTIEVTSFAEIVLNTQGADLAHPAFSNLFVQTQILHPQHAVVFSRRARTAHEQMPWMCHLLLVHGTESGTASFETDREKFLGRGGSIASPAALAGKPNLSNSEGSVLDPVAAIRRTIRLEPKASAKVTLVSGIAPKRDEIFALVEKYQDQSIADRCFELAWTHGLIVLRHLNATEQEAQLYGRLTSALLYSSLLRRANSTVLARNQRGQRSLWSFGISGDLPIVLVYSADVDQIDLVRQLVQAHAYWRIKGLPVDLVILNEDESVYRQSLHDQILNLISANNATQMIDKPGGIFLRRRDQLSPEDRTLLESVARIVLHGDQGTLAEQLQRRQRTELTPPPLRIRARPEVEPSFTLPERELVFFNGTGGFTPDGREYVITLKPGQTTPMPWVNVLANPDFGTLISESGGGYTWSENCHEFRLTPWNNDAVTDVSGEAFYIRDESSGKFWSPTPLPARGETPYISRHGFGYSVFEHIENGIESELRVYVAMGEPVKIAVLKIRNRSNRSRRLTVTGYWEWVLGELRGKNAPQIGTEMDAQTGAMLVRNAYNTDFEGRVVFVTSSELIRSFTADRAEFLGRNGTPSQAAALARVRLSGKTGHGLDPCTALQAPMEFEPEQEQEIVFVIGVGKNLPAAQELARRFQNLQTCRDELQKVWDFWKHTLSAVHVETPELALNFLANGWLLYQTISCRLWARTGFYQSGGAFGFRDQLQDSMALVHTRRELLREQLLRAAAHQFREGDVQHWWHPPSGRGVRTHFSDDYLWLPYATCRYVANVGDTGVLDSQIPFLESRALRPDEEANYDLPQRSAESGTLYEHCVRAIKYGLKFGEHGLPLMGCGDWNDGMNLVGEKGKGESVWLAFFLHDVLKQFVVLAGLHGDKDFAQQCEASAKTLSDNIEKNAWDGQWYRRAYFDNGEPLGSAANPECQIDALPQSWAVISGVGSPERIGTALDAVAHRLIRREAGLIQLFDPPFDRSSLEPGYIKGYVPGVRENGGQYTHGAIWTVMAFALAGETSRAWELFRLINPILHGRTANEIARYKTEPYVIAADVYSTPPHTGRGGWTWYTGSAGWMYRLITETFLGLQLEVDVLRFTPRLPAEWKTFKLEYRFRETTYRINCLNLSGSWAATPIIFLDRDEQPQTELKLVDDQQAHFVEVKF